MKEKIKKPIYKKIWFWLIIILLILIILIPDDNKSSKKTSYESNLTWMYDSQEDVIQLLTFAVEDDNFNGRKLESGNYTLKHSYSEDIYGKNERIYNIFVSDNYYEKEENIPMEEHIGILGAYGNHKPLNIELTKGKYLYIVLTKNTGVGNIIITKDK